jgi:hypothetical protein
MLTLEIQPLSPSEPVDLWAMATLGQNYDAIVKHLGPPHFREESNFPGCGGTSRVIWRVREVHSGAVLCVWDCNAAQPTPALTTQWRVFWSDGLLAPGSGRQLLNETVGAAAGGTVTSLDEEWV